MHSDDWQSMHARVVAVLRDRLRNTHTCSEAVDDCEGLMRSMWDFTAQLLGDVGTRAVVGWSVQVAARDVPLLKDVRVGNREVDFGSFREEAAKVGCSATEMTEAILGLSVTIFRTLSDLAGDSVTGPLLIHLGYK